jgi:hypothetical protein
MFNLSLLKSADTDYATVAVDLLNNVKTLIDIFNTVDLKIKYQLINLNQTVHFLDFRLNTNDKLLELDVCI